jgi:hypothetical protein
VAGRVANILQRRSRVLTDSHSTRVCLDSADWWKHLTFARTGAESHAVRPGGLAGVPPWVAGRAHPGAGHLWAAQAGRVRSRP